ncbi:MAG TPA: ATP-binding cassette domain-containing protein, partial [Roseiarcus sp.]|nr:ATP-binding cassette domain-containing protein [Roseiarcus sp.]
MALSGKSSTRRGSRPSERGALDLWDDGPPFRFRGLPDPAAFWLFLKRNARFIAAIAATVAILGAIALWLAFNQYAATALVLVDPRDVKATTTPEVLANVGGDAIAVESMVQVARSDGFLGALVDQQGLANDSEFNRGAATGEARRAAAIDKLKSKLSIGRRGATYVIDVTMKSRDAQKAARIANAAAKMIVDNQAQLRLGSNQRAIDFLGGKLADLRKKVHDEEEAAAALKAGLKITDAGQGVLLQARRVADLNQQLVLAKTHTEEMRARVEQLRKVRGNGDLDLPTTPEMTVLSALRQDYARLSQRATEKEAVLGERHPDVIALRAQIVDSKRQIAAEEARLVGAAKNDYAEARQREAALADALAKAHALYRRLDLPQPERIGRRFPHEVSGGQLQRFMIAMGLIEGPELVVCDEPTSALDVTTQVEVLTALKSVIRDGNTAGLFVSHDLAVVAQIADRILVLRRGQLVESGTTREILTIPQEPYTKELVAA